MPLQIHPYFRDKEKAMEAAGLIQTRDSVGYTLRVAHEATNSVAAPTLLKGTNWFFGHPASFPTGQTHNS